MWMKHRFERDFNKIESNISFQWQSHNLFKYYIKLNVLEITVRVHQCRNNSKNSSELKCWRVLPFNRENESVLVNNPKKKKFNQAVLLSKGAFYIEKINNIQHVNKKGYSNGKNVNYKEVNKDLIHWIVVSCCALIR